MFYSIKNFLSQRKLNTNTFWDLSIRNSLQYYYRIWLILFYLIKDIFCYIQRFTECNKKLQLQSQRKLMHHLNYRAPFVWADIAWKLWCGPVSTPFFDALGFRFRICRMIHQYCMIGFLDYFLNFQMEMGLFWMHDQTWYWFIFLSIKPKSDRMFVSENWT